MTFTLRINNIQMSSSKEDLVQAKDWMLSTKADPLTIHKDNESPDEFLIKDDEGDASGFGDLTVYTTTIIFGEGSGNNNDWKLEAVKGYLQNEQEHMSGWWKNLSTNLASDFTTAHLDLI